jgi:hypothetical protein
MGKKNIPDLHGRLHRQTTSDPVAGANWTQTVPTNRRWQILTVRYQLITDITAPLRRTYLAASAGATETYRIPSASTQAASLTNNYLWMVGTIREAAAINLFSFQLMPPNIILPEGSTIQSATDNLAPGDQYDSIFIYVMEWIEQIA